MVWKGWETMKRSILALFTVVLGVYSPVFGGKLDQKQIPADSAWLVHLDFETFGSTQIGQLVTAEIKSKHQDKINALQELIGSNLMTDVASVTLFGPDAQEENAVSLIKGRYNKEKLLAILKLNQTYGQTAYDNYTLHTWVDDKRKKEQVGAFAGEDLIVISETQTAIKAALDVLAGKQTSLAQQAQLPLFSLSQTPNGAFIIAAAEGLSKLAGEEHAAILKNSNFMVFITSEQAGNLKAHLQLESETEESAMQIEQVVRGMLAFATLQMKDQPQLQKLLQSGVISRDGKNLQVDLSAPSGAVFFFIKSHAVIKIFIPSGKKENKSS
jgi:hypothetical protein